MSLRKGDDLIAGGSVIKIDSAMSSTSINPVQNKVVNAAIEAAVSTADIDCGTMS